MALAKAGRSMAARMAIMAMTTSNSIRVKALLAFFPTLFISSSLFCPLKQGGPEARSGPPLRHPNCCYGTGSLNRKYAFCAPIGSVSDATPLTTVGGGLSTGRQSAGKAGKDAVVCTCTPG
ncbi:hypothetical protein SBV1_600007 [Verrucomicrobia bacterium]|nr:hypothetical protein SBV1_600007 [Verrucomicrobiota bacterium]